MGPGQDKPGTGEGCVYSFIYGRKQKRGVFKTVFHQKNCTAGGVFAALVLDKTDHGMEEFRRSGPDKNVIRIPFQRPGLAPARLHQEDYLQAGTKGFEMLYRYSRTVIQGLNFNEKEVKRRFVEQVGSLFHGNSVGDLPRRWVDIHF